MDRALDLFHYVDTRITRAMARHGIRLLRLSLGINFLWFGALKFIPGASPAEGLATETINVLTAGLVPPEASIYLLAGWETLIGLGIILGVFLRVTLLLLFVQMVGTLTPLVLFPAQTFAFVPPAPTLEGQYIIKNLVLISAGLVVGATVHGGRLTDEPDPA